MYEYQERMGNFFLPTMFSNIYVLVTARGWRPFSPGGGGARPSHRVGKDVDIGNHIKRGAWRILVTYPTHLVSGYDSLNESVNS